MEIAVGGDLQREIASAPCDEIKDPPWQGRHSGSLQPSTFRSVICPLANNAQDSMQAVSTQGSMHWVLMRRR